MLNELRLWLKTRWDWLQLLVFIGCAPFFLFPHIERVWVFMIIPVVWIVRWWLRNTLIERTVLDGSILLLSVQVLITCIIVPDIWVSLAKISGILYGLILFYSIGFLLKQESFINKAVGLFMISGVIFAIFGFLGMRRMELHAAKNLDSLMKLRDSIPSLKFKLPGAELGFHPNAVGGILVLLIPLLLVFCFWYAKRNKRLFIIAGICLLIEIGVLLLTLSRGSWLAVFISSLVLVFHFIKQKRLILLFTLVFFMAAGVTYVLLVGPKNIPASSAEIEGEIMSRGRLWARGVNYIDQRPLTGIGMNQVRLNPWVQFHTSHLHNHFIHTAAELGIPGLVAYLAILLGTGFMCIEVWRKGRSEQMRLAALGLGCGQLAHFIFGIMDSVPLGAKPGIIFWISLALIAGIYNYSLAGKTLTSRENSLPPVF